MNSKNLLWRDVLVLFGLTGWALALPGYGSEFAMSMALTLAVFVDRQLAGYKAYRVAIIWPYAVAAPAVGLAFQFVFNPGAGIFSYINTVAPGWWDLSRNAWQAVVAIIVAGAWKQVAYSFVFFLAALQSIPRSLIEAAAMDGARPLRRMFDLQMPLLTPTFFFLLVINITDSFTDSFGIVDTLTGGGPYRATDLMVYRIYSEGFKGMNYSGAAAQSVILMLLVMALTFVQFRYVERRVHYT